MAKPRELFDGQIRLEKISKQKDPLERLSSCIDFDYIRKPPQKHFDKEVDRRNGWPAQICVI